MPEALITVLTEVVDRLIALVREGKSNRRELLVNHLEPIFQMLEEVMDDYLAIFSELEREFLDPNVLPSKTIEKLIDRRQRTFLLREKVRQYAKSLPDAFRDEEVERFALLARALLHKEPSFLRPVSEAGVRGFASVLTGTLIDIEKAVVDYHDKQYEFSGSDGDLINCVARTDDGIDGRALIDLTPRELFSLLIRANRRDVESIWSRAAATYYRLKIRLLK